MERIAVRAQVVAFDMLLAACAFSIAFFVAPTQPELGFGQEGALGFVQLAFLYAGIAGIFSLIFRRELSPWRYVSIPDALVLGRSALLTVGVFLLAVFVLDRAEGLPRSTLVMAPLLQMTVAMGVRILRRALHEHALIDLAPLKALGDRTTQAPSMLLIGPSSLADTYLRDAARRRDQAYNPVGIVGTDRRDVGAKVRGVCVIEGIDRLDEALADLRRWNRFPRAILFLEEPARLGGLSADLLGRLKADGVRLLRLPSIVELAQHEGLSVLPMRDINIEELLARDPIELDRRAVGRLLRGRRVMVTGAGGSIGAELTRQAAAFGCESLTVLDASETALFEIEREIAETFPAQPLDAILCDVRDARALAEAFKRAKPDLVFHAAALKHVSMVERHPVEGVRTNVLGTWNVAQAAKASGAAQMVLISTDKAVDPTNVMGATKRLAEAVIQAQQVEEDGTRFSAVRFGNVLGSSGSVVPIFKSQIERGGPVRVTNADMTRYFMTIPEASQLVLHATAACDEDSRRDARLFVLDMGEPVRIMDLARQMIALSGRKDVEIDVVGLRPGEKLAEALVDASETLILAAPKVQEVVSSSAGRINPGHIAALETLTRTSDAETVRQALFELVAQVRGEVRTEPAVTPNLRVIQGG